MIKLAQQRQQLEYKVLAPLPGTTIGNRGEKADLQSYIPGIFNLIIGLAAVIAVTKIIFGGFQYITTDAIAGKSEGNPKCGVWAYHDNRFLAYSLHHKPPPPNI